MFLVAGAREVEATSEEFDICIQRMHVDELLKSCDGSEKKTGILTFDG